LEPAFEVLQLVKQPDCRLSG